MTRQPTSPSLVAGVNDAISRTDTSPTIMSHTRPLGFPPSVDMAQSTLRVSRRLARRKNHKTGVEMVGMVVAAAPTRRPLMLRL
jgi:hypothetical protein